MTTQAKTADGKYFIDGWKTTDGNGNGFANVRGIGWCKFSNHLCAVLVPNVGWVTY